MQYLVYGGWGYRLPREKQRNQENRPSEGFSLTLSIPNCQILGLTRGTGILHIESMLVDWNM